MAGGVGAGQSLPQKWPKFVFAVPKWAPKVSRTPQIDSNQLGTVGDTVWGYRFGGLGLGLGGSPLSTSLHPPTVGIVLKFQKIKNSEKSG